MFEILFKMRTYCTSTYTGPNGYETFYFYLFIEYYLIFNTSMAYNYAIIMICGSTTTAVTSFTTIIEELNAIILQIVA